MLNLLAHITTHEVSFVLAVFLFGLVSGYTLAWSRQSSTTEEQKPHSRSL